MAAAIITGSIALLLFVLSRVPGFSASARLTVSLERDLRILEKLPDGPARDEWAALVDAEALDLVALRRPKEKPDGSVRLVAGRESVWGPASRFVILVALTVATVFSTALADDGPLTDLSTGQVVIVSTLLAASLGVVVTAFLVQRHQLRAARAAREAARAARAAARAALSEDPALAQTRRAQRLASELEALDEST